MMRAAKQRWCSGCSGMLSRLSWLGAGFIALLAGCAGGGSEIPSTLGISIQGQVANLEKSGSPAWVEVHQVTLTPQGEQSRLIARTEADAQGYFRLVLEEDIENISKAHLALEVQQGGKGYLRFPVQTRSDLDVGRLELGAPFDLRIPIDLPSGIAPDSLRLVIPGLGKTGRREGGDWVVTAAPPGNYSIGFWLGSHLNSIQARFRPLEDSARLQPFQFSWFTSEATLDTVVWAQGFRRAMYTLPSTSPRTTIHVDSNIQIQVVTSDTVTDYQQPEQNPVRDETLLAQVRVVSNRSVVLEFRDGLKVDFELPSGMDSPRPGDRVMVLVRSETGGQRQVVEIEPVDGRLVVP